MKRKRWMAGVILAGLLLTGIQGIQAGKPVRGPYLQQGDSDSMIIRWRTDLAVDSIVHYGKHPKALDSVVSVDGARKNHEVLLEGLTPQTRYFYTIGSKNGLLKSSKSRYFETSPERGEAVPTRIWAIGDSGTGDRNAKAVYEAYREFTGKNYTDLWLMLGDNAYPMGTDGQYQRAVFDMYPELLQTTPLWATLGNHDGRMADSADESGPYYNIFSFPRAGEVGGIASGTEAYYSFDYGNIHFIVLDSHETIRSTTGAMMEWMKADLLNTTADWIIAFWHHPPYSKGTHDSDNAGRMINMRENFLPVLERFGVDLVLTGHSHSYERSKLIHGHYGKSNSYKKHRHEVDGGSGREDNTGSYKKRMPLDKGTVYAVAGASGKVGGGRFNHPAMYVSLKQLGSLVIDVDEYRMDVRYLRHNGKVSDYFTLQKYTVTQSRSQHDETFQDEGYDTEEALRAEDEGDVE